MASRIHSNPRMIFLMSIVFTASAACEAWAAGDHFPAKEGSYWLFSYYSSSGGWGSSTVDSGTVKWQIRSLKAAMSFPSQVTATVEQTRSLARRKYIPSPRIIAGVPYDSVYFPPRLTRDTFTLHWLDPGNMITRDTNTCWNLAHDPASIPITAQAVIRDTVVTYGGNSLSAKLIDDSKCRGIEPRCKEPDWYITAAGIGPVRYYRHSSSCLMDAYWEEEWSLISSGVQTTGAVREEIRTGPSHAKSSRHLADPGTRLFTTAGRRVAYTNRQDGTERLGRGVYVIAPRSRGNISVMVRQ